MSSFGLLRSALILEQANKVFSQQRKYAMLLSNISSRKIQYEYCFLLLFDNDDTPPAPLSLAGCLVHQPTIQLAKVEQNTILQAATINKHQI